MQFKDLFSFRNIKNVLIVALIVFLTLPLLVPDEESFAVLKKENILDRDESPLPIFPQENALEKYTKRLKKLYRFNKSFPLYKSNKELAEEMGREEMLAQADLLDGEIFVDSTGKPYEVFFLGGETKNNPNNNNNKGDTKARKANDFASYSGELFFSEDFFGDDEPSKNSQAFVDDTVNLQKGTVMTSDNLLLEPTQEGYYYQGKFYKNGTYPQNTSKNTIEGALKRYHTKVAGKLGKKALYFADENGNLTVGYVKKLPKNLEADIEYYKANNIKDTNSTKKLKNANMYASSKNYGNNKKNYDKYYDRYRGARINGLNKDGEFNPNANYADVAAASLYDMHAAYNLASNKIQTGEIGKDINIKPKDIVPEKTELENALDRVNIATANDPTEQKENVCKDDNTCVNSHVITPVIMKTKLSNYDEEERFASDLTKFVHEFCNSGKCLASVGSYDIDHQDIDLSPNGNELDDLKTLIANDFEGDILEICYINDNPRYEEMQRQLQKMDFKNKNNEPVDVFLRGRGMPADPDASFGEKMITPFEHIIRKAVDPENPDKTIQSIISIYNNIDNDITKEGGTETLNTTKELYKDMFNGDESNIQIAVVEKAPKGNKYIINGPDIPDGYKTEIAEWNKKPYLKRTDDGFTYYEVPKSVLVNMPTTTAVVLVGDEDTRNKIRFKNRNQAYIKTVSKEQVSSYNFDNVKATRRTILDAKLSLMQDRIERGPKKK